MGRPEGDSGPHRGYDNSQAMVSSTSWAPAGDGGGGYWGARPPVVGYGPPGGPHYGSSLQLFPGARTLGQHLASSELGRALVASYRRKNNFEPSERRKLVQVRPCERRKLVQ
ncbi:uncharacterized protein LOC125178144, partial [Hyalella azteca]|uniref:Uncharacterized protein LOC125178144 n=1 Tax=Hyalella azteca TaxID=294128 RepID=A0A979FKZ6_HYAAZ